jgi:hypothetical protein
MVRLAAEPIAGCPRLPEFMAAIICQGENAPEAKLQVYVTGLGDASHMQRLGSLVCNCSDWHRWCAAAAIGIAVHAYIGSDTHR